MRRSRRVSEDEFGKVEMEVFGQEMELEPEPEEESKPSVITLALTPEESSLLTFSHERGKITLTLRPTDDETILDIPPTRIENIIPGAEKRRISPADSQTALDYLKRLRNTPIQE